jgi:hypothetical protein
MNTADAQLIIIRVLADDGVKSQHYAVATSKIISPLDRGRRSARSDASGLPREAIRWLFVRIRRQNFHLDQLLNSLIKNSQLGGRRYLFLRSLTEHA